MGRKGFYNFYNFFMVLENKNVDLKEDVVFWEVAEGRLVGVKQKHVLKNVEINLRFSK